MKAALLSLLVPGAGQLYAGEWRRGLWLLIGLPVQAVLFYALGLSGFAFWLAPVWLWNAADARAAAIGRPLSPTPPILWLLLLNLGAGAAITEVRPADLVRGLPRATPILRGILQPDLIERARATQRATASITYQVTDPTENAKTRRSEGREAKTEDVSLVSSRSSPSSRLRVLSRPSLSLKPAGAGSGRPVRVTGGGFWPNEAAQVVLVASGTEVLARGVTDAAGGLSATVTLPRRPPGRYWIDVIVERPLPRWQATETFLRCGRAMLDTLYMALVGTALAIPASLLLAFGGARNLTRGSLGGRLLYGASRSAMNLLRSVEVLILALMMVVVVGIGPFAGVLAVAIHGVGALGKLYSEAIESIDPGPIEAIVATGAHPAQVVAYGVLPQVTPQFVAFTLYRWDINVRMATVIGLVGGGGIGFILADFINLYRWPQAGTALWMIALAVIAMDTTSALLREWMK